MSVMKNNQLRLGFLFLAWLILPSSNTAALETVIPDLPPLSASSYILMDYDTGTVLAEQLPDERLGSASITKLMTAYIVYQAIAEGLVKLSDEVKISQYARQAEGSRMFLEQGSLVSVHELLQGLVVQSGNDASIALAEHIAGEESYFITMMNAQAKKLGMNNTQFMNVVGFPEEGHYMSARDIATLSRALISHFPNDYKMYSQKEYTYNEIKQYNRNRLLWRDQGIDGLKTGYTESIQYCLAASAKRDNMRLISVVLSAPTEAQRVSDTERLLNYGFRFYKTHLLYSAGESLHQLRVWGGANEYVNAGVTQDFHMVLPRHTRSKLQVKKDMQNSLSAPVQLHQTLGSVTVHLSDDFSRTVPLSALEKVEQGGIVTRVTDGFLKLFY